MQSRGDVRRCLATVANDMLRGTMDATAGGKIAFVLSIIARVIAEEEAARRNAAQKMTDEQFGERVRAAIKMAMAMTAPGPPGSENGGANEQPQR